MKRLIAAATLTSALAATGCVQLSPEGFSDALPESRDLEVKVPQDSGDQPLALGDIADYYLITRNISRQFNGGAVFALTLVHTIVQFPATSVDGDTYTWGPHSDALDPAEWRLVVTDNQDGSYDWTFDGRSKTESDSEFLSIMSGNAIEGTDAHRGRGTLTWNGDNAHAVDPIDHPDANGLVNIVYDLENRDGTQASLEMDIQGVNEEEEPVNATYRYAEALDGSGDFQFVFTADIGEDGSLAENAEIRSRWNADGTGRGDARVTGGDLEDQVIEASECWDGQFRRVYYTDSVDFMPTEGDVSDCAFALASLPDA